MLCSMRGWIWDANSYDCFFGLFHAWRWDVFVFLAPKSEAL